MADFSKIGALQWCVTDTHYSLPLQSQQNIVQDSSDDRAVGNHAFERPSETVKVQYKIGLDQDPLAWLNKVAERIPLRRPKASRI